MHRLFAIRPPRAIRERLLGLMGGGVPNARWQSDAQLHLTLRFIGEVDRHRAEDVAVVLGSIAQPRFSLGLEALGQFERKGRIDTLWIGVRPHDPLKALHNRIDQALVRVGVSPEGRAYLPHITLARLGRTASGSSTGFLTQAILPLDSFDVRDFCLYESRLGRDGASYEIIARYPLEATELENLPVATPTER